MSDIDESVENLTFWRNWRDAVRAMPDDQRLSWYEAIFAFAFDGEEPSDNGIGMVAVSMTRKAIEISRSRSRYGRKGGKQTASKRQANGKQTASKAKQSAKTAKHDNDNDNDNEQIVSPLTPTGGRKRGTYKDSFTSFAAEFARLGTGVPEDYLAGIYPALLESGWRDLETGEPIVSVIAYVKSRYRRDIAAKLAAPPEGALGIENGIANRPYTADLEHIA